MRQAEKIHSNYPCLTNRSRSGNLQQQKQEMHSTNLLYSIFLETAHLPTLKFKINGSFRTQQDKLQANCFKASSRQHKNVYHPPFVKTRQNMYYKRTRFCYVLSNVLYLFALWANVYFCKRLYRGKISSRWAVGVR